MEYEQPQIDTISNDMEDLELGQNRRRKKRRLAVSSEEDNDHLEISDQEHFSIKKAKRKLDESEDNVQTGGLTKFILSQTSEQQQNELSNAAS